MDVFGAITSIQDHIAAETETGSQKEEFLSLFLLHCFLFLEGSLSDLHRAPSLTSFRSALKCHFITLFNANFSFHFALNPGSFLSFSLSDVM